MKCKTPFTYSGYDPSADISRELDADVTKYFQELIGVLCLAIELGRADMLLELALLPSHLVALPCVGPLQQVYCIFSKN